ncbi:MAG: hypothetical protein VKJ46_11725 [Leptolyngbyaceae bacterium]|nr:hypothetical protein [Leptolyngbyaceae bacterium]
MSQPDLGNLFRGEKKGGVQTLQRFKQVVKALISGQPHSCPKCGSHHKRLSRRRNKFERSLGWIGVVPVRCQVCLHRSFTAPSRYIIGIGLVGCIVLVGLGSLYREFQPKSIQQSTIRPSPGSQTITANLSVSQPTPLASTALDAISPPNSFAEAVRIAESASAAGKIAQSSADWLALAAQWQKASTLMKKVPSEDKSYLIAQNRAKLYLQFHKYALSEAAKRIP